MSQKTALLINDTSNSYHWGCYATSGEIRHRLMERGYHVNSVGVVDVHTLRTSPRASAQFSDDGFRRVFLIDNPNIEAALAQADIVVVNGEGTLHGAGQSAFNLLYLIHLAKNFLGKPVYVINTSLYPTNDGRPDTTIEKFYAGILKDVDGLVLRESCSLSVAQRLGLPAVQGFDCLPLYLERHEVKPFPQKDGPIIIGGGLGLSPQAFAKIIKVVKAAVGTIPLHYVTGAPDHPAQDDAKVISAGKSIVPELEHIVADSFEDWANALNNAACLISGRFHHTIAATFLGTPVLAFAAGTPKLHGLCADLGFPTPLRTEQPDVEDMTSVAVELVLSGGPTLLSATQREEQIAKSRLNFANL